MAKVPTPAPARGVVRAESTAHLSGSTVEALANRARDAFNKDSGFAKVAGATGPISGTSDVRSSRQYPRLAF